MAYEDSAFNHINKTNSRSYAWLLWSIAAAFFLCEYLARVGPSVMEPELMKAFSMDAETFGFLSSFFYYAYVAMQMPSGYLVDRYSPIMILGLSAICSALGVYLFACAHTFILAALGRFLTGFGGAFAFVGALKIATLYFPPRYLGFLAGTTQALGMLGAAVGEFVTSYTVKHIGWQDSMFNIGHSLAAIGLVFLLLYCHRQQAKKTKKTNNKLGLRQPIAIVIKNKQSWINGLYAGLIFAPTGALSEVWGPTYFTATRHLDPHTGTFINTAVFLGWTIGGPIIGKISDLIKKRKPVMVVSALLSFISLTLALYFPNISNIVLFSLLFCYGLSNTGLTASYATAGEINPPPVAGLSMAFANMASVIIGALLLPTIGRILDLYWLGQLHNGIRVYSIHAYHMSMLALPICLGLAFVTAFCIKETHCQNRHVQ